MSIAQVLFGALLLLGLFWWIYSFFGEKIDAFWKSGNWRGKTSLVVSILVTMALLGHTMLFFVDPENTLFLGLIHVEPAPWGRMIFGYFAPLWFVALIAVSLFGVKALVNRLLRPFDRSSGNSKDN